MINDVQKVKLRLLGFSTEAVRWFEHAYSFVGAWDDWDQYIEKCEADEHTRRVQTSFWNNTKNRP